MALIPLKGHTKNFPLKELLVQFRHRKASGCLRLNFPDITGFIYMKAGQPVHAVLGSNEGQNAFDLMLSAGPTPYSFSERFTTRKKTLGVVDNASYTINKDTITQWKALLNKELGPFANFEVDGALAKFKIGVGNQVSEALALSLIKTITLSVDASKLGDIQSKMKAILYT